MDIYLVMEHCGGQDGGEDFNFTTVLYAYTEWINARHKILELARKDGATVKNEDDDPEYYKRSRDRSGYSETIIGIDKITTED